MSEKQFRRFIFNNPEESRRIWITEVEINIVNACFSSGGLTSSKLAARNGISIQSSSTQLKRLCDKGWLARAVETQESGGIQWVYRAIRF